MATYTTAQGTIILPTVTTAAAVLPGAPVGLPTLDDTAIIAPNVTVDGTLGSGIVAITPAADVTNSGVIDGTAATAAETATLTAALGTAATAAATVGVNLQVPALPATASGVELLTGGTVTNNAGGQITGAGDGVLIGVDTGPTSVAQVTNNGNITGNAGAGVDMLLGGNVTNTAGTILGATDGVTGTLATNVDNSAAITGTAGAGVDLLAGTGKVTNEAAGVIQGAAQGVSNLGTGAVVNSGTIRATAGVGVQAATGGVTNNTGATISGTTTGVLETGLGTVNNLGTITATAAGGTGVSLLLGGTVDNAGTINAGANGVAVNFGAGGSTLTLEAGSTLNGTVQAVDNTNTLNLNGAAQRTLADIGTTIKGFDQTVLGQNADVEIAGDVSTADAFTLGNGATLTLDGSAVTGTSVNLSGTGDTLDIADAAKFAGTIANLGADDTLNLAKLDPGSVVSLTGGTLTVTDGITGAVSTLATGLPTTGLGLALNANGTGVTAKAGGTTVSVTIPGGTTTGGTTTGGTTGSGGTTLPVGVSTGSGGTTVTTPLGPVTLPVGVSTGSGGTTVTTPLGPVTLPVGVSTGSGGTTITTPLGPVTVPTGGTITLPGTTGGGSTITAEPGGASTLTTTSPTGAQSTQTIPSGSTIAAGTGPAAGDVISISPYASYGGQGQFTIGGHVAAGSGVKSVTITAILDGAPNTTAEGTATVLGTAAVAADGSYTFVDTVGPHLQGFITAMETDALGGTTAVQSPYSLEAGLKGQGHVAEQDLYTPDGTDFVALTKYKSDGSRSVDVNLGGQTFQSDFFDTFQNNGAPDNTFVFDPGHGLDTVKLFRVDGIDHDTLSFKGSDFGNDAASQLAGVLANTHWEKGGAVITDPTSGDTVKLAGITKAELKANTSDFAFHA